MGEFRTFKKNIFSKAFKENLTFKNTDDKESNNIPSNGVNDEELSELTDVGLNRFKENKKVYNNARRVKNIKFFFNYGFPLATFSLVSSFIIKTPRDEATVSTYAIEQTMISDGKMFQDIDDNNYVVTEFEPKDENIDVIEVANTNTIIQYQVKNGTHSVIITVNVDSDGMLSIGSAMSGNFFDRNAAVFEGLDTSDIEAKYQEVVDDIGAFIDESNLNNSYKNEIKELMEQERTVVITTVAEYIKTGEINVIEKVKDNRNDIIFVESIGAIITVLVMVLLNILGLGKIKSITSSESGKLHLSSSKENLVPFSTSRGQRREYIRAEKNRREKVKSLAKEYLTEDSYKYFDK